MRVDLDANVRTKDGHDVGTVQRAVWNPERNDVDEFIVSTGGLFGHDVLVGRDVLETASRDGETLVVDMTKDELMRQTPYDEAYYGPPPAGWIAPIGYGYGMPSYVWPVAVMPQASIDAAPVRGEPGAPTIDKGTPVKDQNGDTIGEVEELVLGEQGGLRALVVRRGNALERLAGGGETFEVAVDQIDVGDGAVHLLGEARTKS